ncbi:hypothetical protein OEM_35000 [Mycobacterium intracellulare subsp. yongonense 05-1390]|nr:hypothetical protein OEM_35000 [Mycobacterium intracellulare subsp. yongonense 05-1390]
MRRLRAAPAAAVGPGAVWCRRAGVCGPPWPRPQHRPCAPSRWSAR